MANTKSTNDFNRLQEELFYKQTTSTSRKRRNKPSTPTTVTTKTTILVSPILKKTIYLATSLSLEIKSPFKPSKVAFSSERADEFVFSPKVWDL